MPGEEVTREPGAVPRYLTGKNPFTNEVTKLYNIPVEAVLGGAEAMYPAYRKKLKDKYVAEPSRPALLRSYRTIGESHGQSSFR